MVNVFVAHQYISMVIDSTTRTFFLERIFSPFLFVTLTKYAFNWAGFSKSCRGTASLPAYINFIFFKKSLKPLYLSMCLLARPILVRWDVVDVVFSTTKMTEWGGRETHAQNCRCTHLHRCLSKIVDLCFGCTALCFILNGIDINHTFITNKNRIFKTQKSIK